jgi:hypothetical protein
MMPAINSCFAADGAGIFLVTPTSLAGFVDPRKVPTAISGSGKPLGWMLFNTVTTAGPRIVNDTNWTFAFPYEPRYHGISRLVDISKSFLATFLWDRLAATATPIPPAPVDGFIFGPYGQGNENIGGVLTNNVVVNFVVDVNLNGGLNQYGFYTTGSVTHDDAARALFGFGDVNNIFIDAFSGDQWGCNHFADFRDVEPPDGVNTFISYFQFSPVIRGWKYGVYSGLPAFSKSYWRRGRFGQFRDMLEQRLFSKYYQSSENKPTDLDFKEGLQHAVVSVKFISPDGKLTKPENTWSSNLSTECTSSVPYFDDRSTNRPPINIKTLNKNIVSFGSDAAGNITL